MKKNHQKRLSLSEKPLVLLIIKLVNTNNLLLVVRTASLTNSVRHHQCAAFAALYQCRSAHFPVCSSLISSTFGRFILRTNRHRYTSLFALKISCIAAILGSGTKVSQPHSPKFRFCPHTLHMPLQSSLQRIFIGQFNKISLYTKVSTFS